MSLLKCSFPPLTTFSFLLSDSFITTKMYAFPRHHAYVPSRCLSPGLPSSPLVSLLFQNPLPLDVLTPSPNPNWIQPSVLGPAFTGLTTCPRYLAGLLYIQDFQMHLARQSALITRPLPHPHICFPHTYHSSQASSLLRRSCCHHPLMMA